MEADQIITVSPSLKNSLLELGAKKVEVITNGYDLDAHELETNKPDKYRIAYAGLLTRGRNPKMLWEALNEVASENAEFKSDLEIYLAGTIEADVIESIESCTDISDSLTNNGYKSHTEIINVYKNSAVLLLVISNTDNASWILPGKMFEYMALKKPIISVGSVKSDASDILLDAGYDPCFDYDDKEGIKAFFVSAYQKYKNNEDLSTNINADKYHRRQLTKSLATCLDQI